MPAGVGSDRADVCGKYACALLLPCRTRRVYALLLILLLLLGLAAALRSAGTGQARAGLLPSLANFLLPLPPLLPPFGWLAVSLAPAPPSGAGVAGRRRELDRAGDEHTELGAEIACLRGELQSAGEAQSEQSLEMMRMRRELERMRAAKSEQAAEIGRLYNLIEGMHSLDFVQLEDYTIKALQIELKAEARRGMAGPDSSLLDAPEEYAGCRQFFQSGYCHFGRGRRPCPNENSHFCLQCGRAHGTAPHLILLRRISDRSLNGSSDGSS